MCANCVRGASSIFRIKHTRNYRSKVEEAQRALGLAKKYYDMFEKEMVNLRSRVASVEITKIFVDKMLPKPKTEQEGRISTWQEKQNLFNRLVEKGHGTEIGGVRGTFYGLWNAATEFADHHLTMRGKSLSDDERAAKRADSLLFGRAAAFKQQAFDVLTIKELVTA